MDFPGSETELPRGLVISASGHYSNSINKVFTDKEWVEVCALERTYFCVGRIEYDDVIGDHRETGFCWHYHRYGERHRFIISHDTKLNYYK